MAAGDAAIISELSPVNRIACAYAPERCRARWAALLALDSRLASVVRSASEPMLAQVRIAWWRETFARPVADWPSGEPLLQALTPLGDQRAAFAELCSGWEILTGEGPLPQADLVAFADGRVAAIRALAHDLGVDETDEAANVAYRWAISDLAANLSDTVERQRAVALLDAARPGAALPRAMRPLSILAKLAERAVRTNKPSGSRDDLLVAMRIGMLGR